MRNLLLGIFLGSMLMTVMPAPAHGGGELQERVARLEHKVDDLLLPMSAQMDLDGYYHGPLLLNPFLQKRCRGKRAVWTSYEFWGDRTMALDCRR